MNDNTLSYTSPTVSRPPFVLGLAAAITFLTLAIIMIADGASATYSPGDRPFMGIFLGIAIGMSICMNAWQKSYVQSLKGESQASLDSTTMWALILFALGGLCGLGIAMIAAFEWYGTSVSASVRFVTGTMLCFFMMLGSTVNASRRATDRGAIHQSARV